MRSLTNSLSTVFGLENLQWSIDSLSVSGYLEHTIMLSFPKYLSSDKTTATQALDKAIKNKKFYFGSLLQLRLSTFWFQPLIIKMCSDITSIIKNAPILLNCLIKRLSDALNLLPFIWVYSVRWWYPSTKISEQDWSSIFRRDSCFSLNKLFNSTMLNFTSDSLYFISSMII
ncbi:hypothetical protein BpHYR1_042758 [Brachionus plicatilis]|uniref:Uncharacterized protein n=1 Tax=Brachionus plicatilis TaxID=10195 RepID=A0A3M7R7J8_BRAPC|nr:hypothetical protein BpHYR1_042758 [Brachionus plicatilis]